jgi:predicted SAM-dependent methyltransferase
MNPLKLHIGSRVKAEGWKTFDISPGPDVDYVGDCRDLSRFADGSIDTIYASHVLEHVPYNNDLQATLNEWFRVLVPGGRVMISVPDFEQMCRLFLQPNLEMRDRFHVMRVIFGGQIDQHDFHAVGLTYEFLNSYLAAAGFAGVTRVDQFGLFADGSILKLGDVPVSLNVIAHKPSAVTVRSAPRTFLR